MSQTGSPPTEWRQERPSWCPHPDCEFRRRSMDAICGGELPVPVDHDGTPNTHRVCINAGEPVFDLQVNATDLDWMRWIFDALDGKETSWLSQRLLRREVDEALMLASGPATVHELAEAFLDVQCRRAESERELEWLRAADSGGGDQPK